MKKELEEKIQGAWIKLVHQSPFHYCPFDGEDFVQVAAASAPVTQPPTVQTVRSWHLLVGNGSA
ncbi:hypothetical protein C5167_017840 [Papaver somniferum]|uniref:Uncharacterized protein n=1 Tax=Papaver somniferum TaxID=3469 RepID=A0A4Y7INL3_PAPSO|nr:hypothetical protein C5167_017840 [Papaver somniferum]